MDTRIFFRVCKINVIDYVDKPQGMENSFGIVIKVNKTKDENGKNKI